MPTITIRQSRAQYLAVAPLCALLAIARSRTIVMILFATFAYGFVEWKSGQSIVRVALEILISLILLSAVLYGYLRFKFSGLIQNNPRILAPRTVTLEEGGIRWTDGENVRFQAWQNLNRPFIFARYIFLFEGSLCLWIPAHAFSTAEEFRNCFATIKERQSEI